MLSTCQDSGPGVTALVQILFLGHCIQVQKSVFLALYRARKITLSFSFPQTMWKLILVHLRGRKHFCIWVEKCFPPLRCTPTSVFYMVWGKKEYKVIFLALYNARKTTFCTWVWCLLSKWWVRKNIFPISYILQKVLRCRKLSFLAWVFRTILHSVWFERDVRRIDFVMIFFQWTQNWTALNFEVNFHPLIQPNSKGSQNN